MESYLSAGHYDLVTPDGAITSLTPIDPNRTEAEVLIKGISPRFMGHQIDADCVFFNVKSTLAQIGLDAVGKEYEIDHKRKTARVKVEFRAHGKLAQEMLRHLRLGAVVGKLFAADERRRVRDPNYLTRMFGRNDRWSRPLLLLGDSPESNDLIIEQIDGRAVAYLSLLNGRVGYSEAMWGFIPTLAEALVTGHSMRELLKLHQIWHPQIPRNTKEGEILLVKTVPLHVRTVFARVVDPLLSAGYTHTSASILQPDTTASGDIYELFGTSVREITDIPLEFYTLEHYREYVFFADRDQLQTSLDNDTAVIDAFKTAPQEKEKKVAVFVVKGQQLLALKESDWIAREPVRYENLSQVTGEKHASIVRRYIEEQPSYPFLKAIDDDVITSEGILLTRYFPSTLMKRMLLSNQVQKRLKGIYFEYASTAHNGYFSAEDRAMLQDLNKFDIPVYWVDPLTQKVLRYTQKLGRDSGMFVPLNQVEIFRHSTVFGIYGSNLLQGSFEQELEKLLSGLLAMREEVDHPLLKNDTFLSLVTGGGPGAMEVGNRLARKLGILSCANIVDFGDGEGKSVINEQKQNPFVEAKMTYRLDKIVERQAEFDLDFPIFLVGGIGTDFEFTLEEVSRKVGVTNPTPIILFGDLDYWKQKITYRFQCNIQQGTIKGSEWLSNCFFCIQTAEHGLYVYRKFFEGTLPIGKEHPPHELGFVAVDQL